MSRPVKEYRVKINGDSLQLFKESYYIGSLGLKDLYQIIMERKRKGTE